MCVATASLTTVTTGSVTMRLPGSSNRVVASVRSSGSAVRLSISEKPKKLRNSP